MFKIAIAVFEFIWFLSWLDIADTVRPSSNGLLSLYGAIFKSPRQIRSEYFEGGAFAQVIQLLTGFSRQVSQNPSAVALHGLCIYRPALEDPNRGVEIQLRMRVVPGQMERNDKIYYQLDERSNPWLTYRVTEKVNDESTTSALDLLGAHPLLQVAFEETLDSASLNMKLVVVPETNTPTHWNSLFRPSLNRDVQVPCEKLCFFGAPKEFLKWIKLSLQHIPCQHTHRSTQKHPLWGAYQFVESWSGRCSVADMLWWTENQCIDDQEQPWIPHSSEWVVAMYDNLHVLQIFLGSPPLLYCLLAKFSVMDATTFLLKSNECLVCMGLGKTQTAKLKPEKICVRYFSTVG